MILCLEPKGRVIDSLRKLFPGQWKYEYNSWHHEKGWHVYCCAAYAPRWDCDDDSFETRYYRSDNGEQIIGL